MNRSIRLRSLLRVILALIVVMISGLILTAGPGGAVADDSARAEHAVSALHLSDHTALSGCVTAETGYTTSGNPPGISGDSCTPGTADYASGVTFIFVLPLPYCTSGAPNMIGTPSCVRLLDITGTSGVSCSFNPYAPNVTPEYVTNQTPSSFSCETNGSLDTQPYGGSVRVVLDTGQYYYVTYLMNAGLSADFTDSQAEPATNPGEYQFVSDVSPAAAQRTWNFGDGTPTVSGPTVTHTYAKPGTFHVTLTATYNGQTATTSHDVVVAAPTLSAGIDFVDAKGRDLADPPAPKIGETVYARLTVSASSGVGDLSTVTVSGDSLAVTPTTAASVGAPTPSLQTSFTLTPDSDEVVTFPVVANSDGVAKLSASVVATNAAGDAVGPITTQRSFEVSALTVSVTTDKPQFTEPEDESGPQPVDVAVTVTVTNPTTDQLTGVNLRQLEFTRDKAGELFDVTQKSGPVPDATSGYPLADLAPGGQDVIKAVFTVKNNGHMDVDALVTAADPHGTTLKGYGTTKVDAKPKYYLKFTSTVFHQTVKAGSPFVVHGTVTNLSDTATETVEPAYAITEKGNAGLQSFAWDKSGIDPKNLTTAKEITLDPGGTASWTLTVLTAYSDPAGDGGVDPSGGTSAAVTFAPWATVKDDDGTTFETDPDKDILATDDDLTRRVAVDDSIPIPQFNAKLWAGGVMYGGLQGLWNAASGMVTGLIELPHVAVSTLQAIGQLQNTAWDSFSPEDRDAFAANTASAVEPIILANEKLAAQGAAKLYTQIDHFVLDYFTKTENAWRTGDYASTAATYSSLATNAIGQIAIPVILGKLAKSGEAVTAIDAAQEASDAKLAATAGGLGESATVQQAASTLFTIPTGAIPTIKQIASLFGIGENEIEALQQLAKDNDFLLTVRSRAASSLDWINGAAAMLKPEALKIKSVSALDVELGYPAKYQGALVFKEPTPLIQFRTSGGDLADLVRAFVEEKGFQPGTSDYDNAIARMNERIKEWNKWAPTYKYWSKRKWIDVSFNWKGNAMSDPTVSGSGKFAGFHLAPLGDAADETYVVKMYNQRVGRYVPVTGDIDPIAFTHVDGSPLTAEEHAELLNEMRRNPYLQSQHGESATYTDGGIKFIASQFKDNEALLQFGPDGSSRIVRFNAQQSVWTSATDYHLVWDGGFVDTGSEPVVHDTLSVNLDADESAEQGVTKGTALPLPGDGATDGANVGRCSVTFSTAANAPEMIMSANGQLTDIEGAKQLVASQEHTCFTAGPIITLVVKPATVVTQDVPAGATEVPIDTGQPAAQRGADTGLAVGETVDIGAGDDDSEDGTIADFGSIIFAKPLKHPHAAGEVIEVVRAAPRSGSRPTNRTPQYAKTRTREHSVATSGTLAATGITRLPIEVGVAAFLLVLGGTVAAATSRRRRGTAPR